MPQLTHRPSGLVSVHADADARSLERELQRFDPRLFLTFEMDRGQPLWLVMCEHAGDRPPMPVCAWRDPQGRPLPLSSGLLELVRSLRPRGGPDEDGGVLRVREANERLRRQVEAEREALVEEVAAEFEPRFRDAKRTMIPRSKALASSRYQAREREAEALRNRRAQAERNAYNRRRIAEGKEPV